MKKNLLKSMLVALMVMVGGSAWAENWSIDFAALGANYADKTGVTISAKVATVGGTDLGTCTVGDEALDSRFVLQTGTTWMIRKANGLYQGNGGGRSMGFLNCTKGQTITIIGTGDPNPTSNATLKSQVDQTYTYTVNEDGDVKFTPARYLYFTSVSVEDPSASAVEYTVKYVNQEGTEIKASTTGTGEPGSSITLSESEKASFISENIKYIYLSDDTEGKTIANDGSTIVTITFRVAATYSYTLKSSLGATLATGSGFEGETLSIGYPRYQLVEGKFYEAAVTNKEYRKTITLSADNASATVDYAEKAGVNAVFFVEGEDVEGMTVTTANNIPARASNAEAGVSTEDLNITTLPAGKYIFHAGVFTSKSSSYENYFINFGIGANTFKAACSGANLNEVASEEITLTGKTAVKFLGTTSADGAQFDYLWIEKTGDYVITPAYGKIWENGETTIDENLNTIAEVSAAYFNDFAKAKDTVRVAVEVTSPSVPSAPARIIAKGSISAFAGPDNIFSKPGIELGADTIDIILTDDALAKIKEAESLKFVYTNLTLKSIELIEAVADYATLAEQAKLQNEITKAEGMLADENKTNGRDEFLTAINAAKALLTSLDIDAIKAGITALQTAEQTFIKANYFIDIAAGQYYIIDAETGKFMAAGHNYSTRGIVNTIGLDLTITPNTESRKVTIDTRIANGGNHFLGTDLYMDASVAEWALEYRGFGFWITNGTQYISIDENDNLVMSDEPREWIIVTPEGVKEQRMEDMALATKDAPKDATWAIQCANFNRNDQRISAWKVSEDCTNKNLSGGSDDNRCAESYHSTFTISQTIKVPKGVYALTAQGFYRQDENKTEATPVFFANEETGAVLAKTGNEGNMNDASASFSAGNYTINPIYVEVGTDSILKVGIKGTATNQWVIFDNFQLKYYGSEVSIDEIKNAAIYAEMLALREQLKNIKPEVEIQVIKDSIDNVLNSTENPEGAEAINNTIVSLKAVLEVAQAYVRVKTILPNMKQFTEETNFYTEEALNQYYTQWFVKYQNGTLTKEEANALQDPNIVAGHHSANTVDDLLMSVWDENPENWESYHVNNWSTEGGTDGSNFVVPFIEYWTGNANNLAPKTLTATINNLEQGNYQVSVRVRVRVKDGANDPTGITMTVNDELPTNVCAGTQVGETQFYMGEFTAVGDVYSDGVLKFKFNVLEGNNISWLAFKDVVYTRLSDVVGIAGVKSENKLDGTVYNLNGQKVEKAQRGLYIMNGKKVVVK